MILLISAQQPLLDGPVDERFGRSPWLVTRSLTPFTRESKKEEKHG
jgi:hypothetical protein